VSPENESIEGKRTHLFDQGKCLAKGVTWFKVIVVISVAVFTGIFIVGTHIGLLSRMWGKFLNEVLDSNME
jgi:hypothetical protein